MKSIRLNQAEADALLEAADRYAPLTGQRTNGAADTIWRRLRVKVQAAMAPAPEGKGLDVKPIEAALIAHSRGRVVPLLGAPGHRWARLSKEGTELGVDVPKAEVLGAWLARQGWMTSTLTIADVFRRWPEWYSKAEAERAPNLGQGSTEQRRPTTAGRRPPGLG